MATKIDLYKKDIPPTEVFRPTSHGYNLPVNTTKPKPTNTTLGPGPTLPTFGPSGPEFPVPGRQTPGTPQQGLYNPFNDVIRKNDPNQNMEGEFGPAPKPYQPTITPDQKPNISSVTPYDPSLADVGPLTLDEKMNQRDFADVRMNAPDQTPAITPDKPQQEQEIYTPPDVTGQEPYVPTAQQQQGKTNLYGEDGQIDALLKGKTIGGVTGEDAEIKGLTQNHERDVARLSADGMAEARAIAASKGYPPGSEQYNQVMRSAQMQINEATLASQRNLYGTIRQKREKALENLSELSNKLWGRQQDVIQNERQEMQDLLSYIDSPAVKRVAATFDDPAKLKDWLKTVMDEEGQWTDQYDENGYEMLRNRAIDYVMGSNPEIVEEYTDENRKFDEEGFLKDSRIKDKVGKQIQDITEADIAPIKTATEDRELKESIESDVDEILAGKMSASDLTPQQWSQMNDNQKSKLSKVLVDFNTTNMEFNNITELLASPANLKVDVIESSIDNEPHEKHSRSAGKGNGTIVLKDGVPYRLTRYWTKKDTIKNAGPLMVTKKDERKGRLYGVRLDGKGEGTEELLSETDWE